MNLNEFEKNTIQFNLNLTQFILFKPFSFQYNFC